MKIQLFLDEDVHSGLAHALRKRGYDVIHAQELDRKGRSNLDQLFFAIGQERCLFRFNVKDFVILHNEQVKAQQEHWGIIVSTEIRDFKKIVMCYQQVTCCKIVILALHI